MKKYLYFMIALSAGLVLAGCGAVFINHGSRDSAYAQHIANPNFPPNSAVPEENRVIGDFEDGSKYMNPKLYGAGLGIWFTYSSGSGMPDFDFVAPGGANDTKNAAHVYGTLFDRGDGRYPAFVLEGKFKNSGYYDLTPFKGIRFYYKCPTDDRCARRRFGFGIASTDTIMDGGVCRGKCGNDYGADLPSTNDWAEESFDFSDLKVEENWGDPIDPPDFTDHLKEVVCVRWQNGSNNVPGAVPVDFWVDEVEFY